MSVKLEVVRYYLELIAHVHNGFTCIKYTCNILKKRAKPWAPGVAFVLHPLSVTGRYIYVYMCISITSKISWHMATYPLYEGVRYSECPLMEVSLYMFWMILSFSSSANFVLLMTTPFRRVHLTPHFRCPGWHILACLFKVYVHVSDLFPVSTHSLY